MATAIWVSVFVLLCAELVITALLVVSLSDIIASHLTHHEKQLGLFTDFRLILFLWKGSSTKNSPKNYSTHDM